NETVKHFVHRPRPVWDEPIATATGTSFPSGHAMGAMVLYGMLGYLLNSHLASSWRRGLVSGLMALVVLTVGLSRMVLGVHYLGAVRAGFALGGVQVSVRAGVCEGVRGKGRAAGDGGPA